MKYIKTALFFTISYLVHVRSPAEMVQEKTYRPDTGATNSPEWTEYPPPSFKTTLSNRIAWCNPRLWRLWERWAWNATCECSPCGTIRLSSVKLNVDVKIHCAVDFIPCIYIILWLWINFCRIISMQESLCLKSCQLF